MSEDKVKVMGYTIEKLLDLLPAIYRQRDYKLEKPLEDLIGVIAEQVAIIEKDIGGLYEDWFIETCSEWVTSYIAELMGARSLSASRASLNNNNPISQRAYVANTIAYRRRKGTTSMLEQLARDITFWGANVVEFFQLLATTQNLNHLRLENHRTPDLRQTPRLELLDTPFDDIAHTAEVRRITSERGHYNIPNVGIFLWRLQSFPSPKEVRAFKKSSSKFMFNPFGYPVPLFNHPILEQEIAHLAEEVNVPVPIRIRAIYEDLDKYYGDEKSIFIGVKYSGEEYRSIPTREIEICNLSKWDEAGWQHPISGKISIDPITGKIALSKEADEVRVTYHYGFSSKIGGGCYVRPDLNMEYLQYSPLPLPPTFFKISQMKKTSSSTSSSPETIYKNIQDAINAWNGTDLKNIIFEIQDSENYNENIEIALPVDSTVVIKASQEQRPVLKSIRVTGDSGSKLILDGLWIENNDKFKTPILLEIGIGSLKMLAVHHCTLVPGQENPSKNLSIYLEGGNDGLAVSLDKTICGRVQLLNSLVFDWEGITSGVENEEGHRLVTFLKKTFNIAWLQDDTLFIKSGDDTNIHATKDEHSLELKLEQTHVILKIDGEKAKYEFVVKEKKVYTQSETSFAVQDSIIDAKGDNPALSVHTAKIENTSIFGKTEVERFRLASNTIFTGVVTSKITQQGCMRFSYIPPNSKTPWRYMCQPTEKSADQSNLPRFTSEIYGEPGYAQLHRTVAKEIFEGADNGAEMGTFNHLFQPHRIADLRASLNEYLRFGLETGVYLVT
jgi:hypothetical protein